MALKIRSTSHMFKIKYIHPVFKYMRHGEDVREGKERKGLKNRLPAFFRQPQPIADARRKKISSKPILAPSSTISLLVALTLFEFCCFNLRNPGEKMRVE